MVFLFFLCHFNILGMHINLKHSSVGNFLGWGGGWKPLNPPTQMLQPWHLCRSSFRIYNGNIFPGLRWLYKKDNPMGLLLYLSFTQILYRISFMKTDNASAESRAILKPVYRFGIPNSNPQTLKSVDFWCKLSSTFLVAEPRERCFELFRTQNAK